MSHFISPYDRENGYSENGLGLAFILSVAFHLLAAWAFLFLFPALLTLRANKPEYLIVDLIGDMAPAAPAAPANLKVDPNQKGPDVVEAPKSDPVLPQPPVKPVTPDQVVAPPDVIPLGPKTKAPEKPPEIKKTPPPKITPPKVEEPKPKPKPQPNQDAAINKRLEDLKRKREADQLDEQINARMVNLNLERGRGEGDSSEISGSSGAQRLHPEVARYLRHIRDIISNNWVPPVEASSRNNKTLYQITIDPSGRITGFNMEQSSGNQAYDLSVERAITKSNPLPPLTPIFGGKPFGVGLNFESDELQRLNRQRNSS